jgi:hypothetical protein
VRLGRDSCNIDKSRVQIVVESGGVAMTSRQKDAVQFLALGTMTTIALWLIVVTILASFKMLHARHGWGWTLAAAISTSVDMRSMFVGVAAIVMAGLAAAGANRRPSILTYATGIAVVLGLIASLWLLWLMADDDYASQIRGTTRFANIKSGPAFMPAAAAFAMNMEIALGAGLAALLGISILKAKTDE